MFDCLVGVDVAVAAVVIILPDYFSYFPLDCWYCFVCAYFSFFIVVAVVYLARSLEIWPETYFYGMHHANAKIMMKFFSISCVCVFHAIYIVTRGIRMFIQSILKYSAVLA